jgi:hypothetical protein
MLAIMLVVARVGWDGQRHVLAKVSIGVLAGLAAVSYVLRQVLAPVVYSTQISASRQDVVRRLQTDRSLSLLFLRHLEGSRRRAPEGKIWIRRRSFLSPDLFVVELRPAAGHSDVHLTLLSGELASSAVIMVIVTTALVATAQFSPFPIAVSAIAIWPAVGAAIGALERSRAQGALIRVVSAIDSRDAGRAEARRDPDEG